MWSTILSFAGLLLSYFGISYLKVNEQLEQNVSDVKTAKRIKILLHCLFFLSFAASLWSDIENKHENTITAGLVKTSADTIGVLRKQLDSTRKEVIVAKKAIIDTVKWCSQSGIDQTVLTEQRITDAVSKGFKLAINETRESKKDLSRQIRDSTAKLKPAYIEFSVEHGRGLIVERKHDTLSAAFYFTNSGDMVAYAVDFHPHIIGITNDGGVFEFKNGITNPLPQDLSSRRDRWATLEYVLGDSDYHSLNCIVCIANGSYFLDEKLKNKKQILIGRSHLCKTGQTINYNLALPMDTLLSRAVPIRLNK